MKRIDIIGQAWKTEVLQLLLNLWLTTLERCCKSGGNCGLGEITLPSRLCFLLEYIFSS